MILAVIALVFASILGVKTFSDLSYKELKRPTPKEYKKKYR